MVMPGVWGQPSADWRPATVSSDEASPTLTFPEHTASIPAPVPPWLTEMVTSEVFCSYQLAAADVKGYTELLPPMLTVDWAPGWPMPPVMLPCQATSQR